MSRIKDRLRAEKVIRAFLATHPTRTTLTIDEFADGRGPRRYPPEPPTPFNGEPMAKKDVAHVFSKLQTEGILGRPFRPLAIPWDMTIPRQFPVLTAQKVADG
jgi:hypothetical protein